MTDAANADPSGPAWGVPVEKFADHAVLRPPNRLLERATRTVGLRDRSEAEAILRAENALEMLSSEFDSWMEEELTRLERLRGEFSENLEPSVREALYRSAHDLRGQSATFGFPLAGEIADGLCQLLEDGEPAPPQAVVDRHVEAIRAIVHENARDRDHLVGATLVTRLAQLRGELAAGKVKA